MSLKRVADPEQEPVTLAQAKLYLRVDDYAGVSDSDEAQHPDDALIARMIRTARERCEDFTRRAFIDTAFELYLDRFEECIRLPMGQVSRRNSPGLPQIAISYVDPNGAEQTLANSEYQLDDVTLPARIRPAYGKAWPSIRPQFNAVKVAYTAGYGDVDDQPGWVQDAILIVLADLYEQRGSLIVGTSVAEVSKSAEFLMWPHRLWPV